MILRTGKKGRMRTNTTDFFGVLGVIDVERLDSVVAGRKKSMGREGETYRVAREGNER